jgi:nucleotide-binding universal stress UspA family protein
MEGGKCMRTRILVPLDGSRLAEQSLLYAMTLGRSLPAELVLLCAVSIPSDVQEALEKANLSPDPLIEELEIAASEYLDAMSHLLSKAEYSFSHVVLRSRAADAIVEYTAQMDIQLIVMASHGATGLKRWTHGSVAEKVLQSAPVPVLLVRAKEGSTRGPAEARPCRRVLVPLDGSKLAEQVLPTIIPIATALGCEVTLFRVLVADAAGPLTGRWYLPRNSYFKTADQDAQSYLERLASHIKEQGVPVSTATHSGPVANSIIDYAEGHDVDLIAMCTHGRTGIARWALGSVADRVLRAGDKPILLVRARRGRYGRPA